MIQGRSNAWAVGTTIIEANNSVIQVENQFLRIVFKRVRPGIAVARKRGIVYGRRPGQRSIVQLVGRCHLTCWEAAE